MKKMNRKPLTKRSAGSFRGRMGRRVGNTLAMPREKSGWLNPARYFSADRDISLGDSAYNVGGMLTANFAGSWIAYVLKKIPLAFFKKNPQIFNILVSVGGGALTYVLPKLPVIQGLNWNSDAVRNMRKGAFNLFALTTVLNAVALAQDNLGVRIPGLASKYDLLSTISQIVSKQTSGVGGYFEIFGEGDYEDKYEELKNQLTDVEEKIAELGTPKNLNQKELYLYAKKLASYAKINLENANDFIKEEDFQSAGSMLSSAKEHVLLTQGFIAGLSASPMPTEETTPLPMEQMPQTSMEQMPQTSMEQMAQAPVAEEMAEIVIEAPTGEEAVITPPETPEETPVTEGGIMVGSTAFALDNVISWAHYAGENTGMSPADALTSWMLKYLAYRGHVWAYGKDQVVASGNYAPSGVAGASQSPAYLVHGYYTDQQRVFKVDSKQAVRNLADSIMGY